MALCAAAMVLQAGWKTGTPPQYALALLVAAATLCSYNFHYLLASMHRQPANRLAVLRGRPAALLLMMAGGVTVLLIYPSVAVPPGLMLVAVMLTLLYSVPLLPVQGLAFTRKLGVLKTLWLAFTWTFVTGFLPFVAGGTAITGAVPWLLAFRFCFMLILCILFDNRDIAVDQLRGFSSLATQFSPLAVRRLMAALLFGMLISGWQMLAEGAPPTIITPIAAGIILNGIIYFLSLKKQDYFFYYFVVDGSMVLTAFISWLSLHF